MYTINDTDTKTTRQDKTNDNFNELIPSLSRENIVNATYGQDDTFGDGVTDNSSKINEIINGLDDGDILYFPSGEYFINNPITINKSNVTIRGAGDTTIIKCGSGGDLGIFAISQSDIKIENIKIDGQGLDGTYGFSFDECNNIIVEECSTVDLAHHCVVIHGSENVWVNNCHFENRTEYAHVGNHGIDLDKGTVTDAISKNVLITNNYVYMEGRDASKVENSETDRDWET